MIIQSRKVESLELVVQGFEDLKLLSKIFEQEDVFVENPVFWRDKYHGREERSAIVEKVLFSRGDFEGPGILNVFGRTTHGQKRKIRVGYGSKIRVVGSKNWHRNYSFETTDKFYYVGADIKQLVHGLVVRGNFAMMGSRHYSLKEETLEEVHQAIYKLGASQYIYQNKLPLKIVIHPLMSPLKKFKFFTDRGYATENWKTCSQDYSKYDQILEELFLSRKLGRFCRWSDRADIPEAIVKKVIISESLPAPIFRQVHLAYGLEKIIALPGKWYPRSLIPEQVALIKYFN